MRVLIGLSIFFLTGCIPEMDTAPKLHDIAIFSNARDLQGLYGYVYGEPMTLNVGDTPMELKEGTSDDPLAMPLALLIDEQPYLKEPLKTLSPPPTRVQRIPLSSDVQLEVGEAARATEVIYFDGDKWFTLSQDPAFSLGTKLIPRERIGGLRGVGELTNKEADTLVKALKPRAPLAISVLPNSLVPNRRVPGLGEYLRTVLYVQQTIPTDNSAYAPPSEVLLWEILAEGSQAVSSEQASYELISSQEQLIQIWNRAYGTGISLPALPDVDLRRETILAVFLDTKPSGGYGLEVKDVSLEDGDIYVDLNELAPEEGSIATQALTTPWLLIRVLRGDVDAAWFQDSESDRLLGVARRVAP